MRRKVLFLCTHNSARSQMAEGLLRSLGEGGFEAHSAGSVATEVRPEAVAVMGEIGIDLSGHASKTLDRFLHQPFDLVVTVCDHARDTCPTFPNAGKRLHWSIADPGAVRGSDDERRAAFRAARAELEGRIREEIIAPEVEAKEAEHFRALERMYLSAPTNAYYRPRIFIERGSARITIDVRADFFHAAGSVHGSVYFKALDDACFFAAGSLVERVMVVTSQFNIHLLRPISAGRLTAIGRVVHAGNSSILAEGSLRDGDQNLLARGEGTFVKSRTELDAGMGYQLP